MIELICNNAYSNIKISLNIEERITVIGGNSGSGKTLMFNAIKDANVNSMMVECNVDSSRFIILSDEEDIGKLTEINDMSIVFVDRYDSFGNDIKSQIWKKMKITNAIWIIATRNPDFPKGLCCSNRSFTELKCDVINDVRQISIFHSYK